MLTTINTTIGSTSSPQTLSDLSPYELLRLEKIQRNTARLEALGLLNSKSSTCKLITPLTSKHKKNVRQRQRPKAVPTRFSKRLKGQKDDVANKKDFYEDDNDDGDEKKKRDNKYNDTSTNTAVFVEGEEKNGDDVVPFVIISYTQMPQNPDQLDDDEFGIYASLRAWRLRRKNELEVEPYKICQNRTLCELIRRARNDCLWGRRTTRTRTRTRTSNIITMTEDTNKNDDNDNSNNSKGRTMRSDEDVANELIDCWGLGPSKVAIGGFGWEMMEIITQDDNTRLLEMSRGRTNQQTKIKKT